MNSIKKELVLKKINRHNSVFLILILLPICGHAQNTINESYGDKKKYYFSPAISISEELSNNANLDNSNKSGYFTKIIPSLRWIANTARVKGFVDYSLTATMDSEGAKQHYVRNRLNANAEVEIVDQFAFVDIAGSISTQPISAFRSPVIDSRPSNNSAEVKKILISPYFLGQVKDFFNYKARYSIKKVDSGSESIGNSDNQLIEISLESPEAGGTFRWTALANYEDSNYELGRNIKTSTVRGSLIYGLTPQLAFSLIGGGETTNQILPKNETHSILGLGIQWHPSQKTRLTAAIEKRYFGNAHNVIFEHRSGKTIWRYTDVKGISSGLNNSSAASGSIFELLDAFYKQIESDPVQRTQLVLTEIERLGLTSETQVFNDFLRSANTLQRTQNLSLILIGQRSTLTLNAFRSSDRRLAGATDRIDDLKNNNEVRQNGLNLLASHRLNSSVSIFTNFKTQSNTGTVPGLSSKIKSVKFGINKNLSRRTNASVQLNRSLVDNGKDDYGESSVLATMTHRF